MSLHHKHCRDYNYVVLVQYNRRLGCCYLLGTFPSFLLPMKTLLLSPYSNRINDLTMELIEQYVNIWHMQVTVAIWTNLLNICYAYISTSDSMYVAHHHLLTSYSIKSVQWLRCYGGTSFIIKCKYRFDSQISYYHLNHQSDTLPRSNRRDG